MAACAKPVRAEARGAVGLVVTIFARVILVVDASGREGGVVRFARRPQQRRVRVSRMSRSAAARVLVGCLKLATMTTTPFILTLYSHSFPLAAFFYHILQQKQGCSSTTVPVSRPSSSSPVTPFLLSAASELLPASACSVTILPLPCPSPPRLWHPRRDERSSCSGI